ncbi:MAG: hypothetical protein CL927_02830 [Deltaproteobacteria bacterium]|nr:hypothetical protein [Deltaproteobacteria bacterium]HCH62860.1 hypothetical protein [Deltaproteobacteria bacterium]
MSTTIGRWSFGAGLLGLGLGLWLGAPIACDDAAIGFRFAERLATGQGYTYVDGPAVFGASTPLWTLLMAMVSSLGLPIEATARVMGAALLGTAAALATNLACRVGPQRAATGLGLAAGMLVALDPHTRTWTTAGLGTGVALVLTLAVPLALHRGQMVWAGALAGLAMVHKLDGALLVLSMSGALASVRDRRGLLQALGAAALLVLPVTVLETAWFGSPVPQSVVAKLAHTTDPGRLWPMDWLLEGRRGLLLFPAMGGMWLWRSSRSATGQVAIRCLGLHFLLHLTAVTFVNLGDAFPWYLVVLQGPLVVLGVAGAMHAWSSGGSAARGMAALVMVPLGIAVLSTHTEAQDDGPSVDAAFELDRRAAGWFLQRHADPQEVVETPHGWVAHASKLPVLDPTGITGSDQGTATYSVRHGLVPQSPQTFLQPDGMVELARFDLAHRLDPKRTWFVVFGRPNAAAVGSPPAHRDDAIRVEDHALATAWRAWVEQP